MSKKDIEIKATIESILENSYSGQHLKNYFDGLPDKNIRRAISILSSIYPGKTTSSDDDFSFILYMFSGIKFLKQESFFAFVSAINILEFTEHQKKLLIDVVKHNIEILYEICTFELDTLLVHLFEPKELFQYLEVLAEQGSRPVLRRVSAILRRKDFSTSCISDEKIESLKQKISESINR